MQHILAKIVTPELIALRNYFKQSGFDLRIVGGAVRDILAGKVPHDVDLCTDAFPDEQAALYDKGGYHSIPTGAEFGTYTVMINKEGYEITSLRTESDHDGRHAKMNFCRDWQEDLSRRDLTINAMSLSFDGELFDPFGGKADLEAGVVRFVGNPVERMTEDYLRILRYFRFMGRYGNMQVAPDEARALRETKSGLQSISVERIWKEISQILVHPRGPEIVKLMMAHKIFEETPISRIEIDGITDYDVLADLAQTKNPITMLAALAEVRYMMPNDIKSFAKAMKFSSVDTEIFNKIGSESLFSFDEKDFIKMMVLNKVSREIVMELTHFVARESYFMAVRDFVIPDFPPMGDYLKASGMQPGREMGERISRMKQFWADHEYQATVEEMMQVE